MTVQYSDEFFTQYADYLLEPKVREAHYRVLKHFVKEHVWGKRGRKSIFRRIFDFGCGTCEFGRHISDHVLSSYLWRDDTYTGIDLDTTRADCEHARLIAGDYRDVPVTSDSVVVSLFATEIHLPWEEHEELYQRWFDQGAAAIMVAGFYYDHCPDDDTITETSGYTVYQTRRSQPISKAFDELRMMHAMPPGMWKHPYTEVWRILTPQR